MERFVKATQDLRGNEGAVADVKNARRIDEYEKMQDEYADVLYHQEKKSKHAAAPKCEPRSSNRFQEYLADYLSKIKLEVLSGNLTEWEEWIALFDPIVHKNERLAKIDKFALLKKYFDGPAAAAISYLKSLETSCEIAMQILPKKYDQPKRLKQARIQAIFDLDGVTRAEDFKSLRRL